MLIDTSKSPFAKAWPLRQEQVFLKDGLLKERTEQCMDVTIPSLLKQFTKGGYFHEEENFQIAAGEIEGEFFGTPYGDGDFYKLLEAATYKAYQYGDKQTEELLDFFIALIQRAQCEDGYISTKQIIGERHKNGIKRHGDIEDFEVYNFGHLFTAACIHKRLSGKDNFLQIAEKAADYLFNMYEKAVKKGEVQTAVCPSHYMGLIELWRTTGEKKYKDLASLAIHLRDKVTNGTDDNQDKLSLAKHEKIVGHAVRATYLYAGVADLYLEEGWEELLLMLQRVWRNLTEKKLYITGGCGALYHGMSPYGNFLSDQRVHQAFGYEYQLPNITAYNETCAALGNIFWNYRMFAIDPQAIYFDIIERTMYNLAFAAGNLSGDKFFYENMLRRTKKLDYKLIWPLRREKWFECFCCPTNLSRFMMELSEYLYMVSKDTVYLGIYGASKAEIRLENGAEFQFIQQTNYPWDKTILLEFSEIKDDTAFTLAVRIPGWLEKGRIMITENGQRQIRELSEQNAGTYHLISFKNGVSADTKVELQFDMDVRFTAANPMIEEDNNQVAVECGPLVYCVESADIEIESVDELLLPTNAKFCKEKYEIEGFYVISLQTEAAVLVQETEKKETEALYHTLKYEKLKMVPVRFIPYFAWDNRGDGEMRIWLRALYR